MLGWLAAYKGQLYDTGGAAKIQQALNHYLYIKILYPFYENYADGGV